jgi:hypothetical protein
MATRWTHLAVSAMAGDGTNAGIRAYIGATPKIVLYTGAVPASAEDTPAGTVLAIVPVAAFGAASVGVITTTGGTVNPSLATGTAGCFALFKTDGTTKIADGSVAKTSGGDLNLDDNVLASIGTVTIGTTTITVPHE